MGNPFDVLIDSYLENKVGIDSGFLSKTLSKGLQENIKQLQEGNLMKVAGIGNNQIKDPDQTMRGDSISWMDKSNPNKYEQEFLGLMEAFMQHLNNTCYTGINAYEFHYAIYEPGSSYKRHTDQFNNDSDRKYSLINYLNDDWLEADGGQLLLYQTTGIQKIIPHAQTAVFFDSHEMEHEVTIAHRPRMSISGWLKQI
jgi:SM-20-related protein